MEAVLLFLYGYSSGSCGFRASRMIMRMQNTIMRTPAARMRSFFSSGAREALVRPSTRIRIVYMKTMAKGVRKRAEESP